MSITGAKLFIKALKEEKVDTLFGYPGGYVTDIFNELLEEPSIRLILPRHEQALVHEADGYARATGKVGVCLVTSGPGATNTITGLATANFDSVPLVCFTGQVPSQLIGNDAFQEADIVGITRSVTKHNYIVTKRSELGKTIKEAFHIASTGRPGVVLVDLPVDVIKALGEESYPKSVNIRGYKPSSKGHPGQIKRAAEALSKAKKPLFLAGGGVIISGASNEFTALVEKTKIPVVTTVLGIGSIPSGHSHYIGNLGMHGQYAANKAVGECDVLFSIGTRFSDRITGALGQFAKNAKIIHVDIDPAAISRNVTVDIPIVGDAKLIIEDLLECVKESDTERWLSKIKKWKEDVPLKKPEVKSDKLSPVEVIEAISKHLPDAVVTTDVGQHQMWTTQFASFRSPRSLITSGGLGTMGFGLPSAIGAAIGRPDKKVVSISGDGGIQMNIQELATAVQQELPILIAVLNNGYLGMVRQFQDLFYNKRYVGTCLGKRSTCPASCSEPGPQCPAYTPDFVKLAEAYGAAGYRVTSADEIGPVLEKAAKVKGRPALVEFIIDPECNVMPMVPSGRALTDMILEG